jgi:hypothetical protein
MTLVDTVTGQDLFEIYLPTLQLITALSPFGTL